MYVMTDKLLLSSDEWNEKIAEWKASGKGMQPWCQDKKLPYYAFRYRFRKARDKKCIESLQRSSFVELETCNPCHAGIEIHCNNLIVKLSPGFNSDTLIQLLTILGGIS